MSFWWSKVRRGDPFFDMDPQFEVLLEHEESSDCGVDSIVENARLRSGWAKSHVISSTEARERGIFRFHGRHVFCGVTTAHMQSPSLRVLSRGDHLWPVCREPEAARDLTCRFSIRQRSSIDLFVANAPVTFRKPRKLVFDEFQRVQCPAWRPIF